MKFMLLQDYVVKGLKPMSEWAAGEPEAHMQYQRDLNAELAERGELVEAQALTGPDQAQIVTCDGSGPPVVTDGPFPEAKEVLAGYRMVDVESRERAIEIAAKGSAAPGPGGVPIAMEIEVREVMWRSDANEA